MTAAIYDFPALAKAANLDALEGKPQNQVAPVVVLETVAGNDDDAYGMYAPEVAPFDYGC